MRSASHRKAANAYCLSAAPKQYAARICNVTDPGSAYTPVTFVAHLVKPAAILLARGAQVFRADLTRGSTLRLSLPRVDNQPSGALCLARGISIAFTGGNDRAFHQHMPDLRKFIGLSQIGILSQGANNRPDLGEMHCGRAPYRAISG